MSIGNALKRSVRGLMLSGVILFKIDRTLLLTSCEKDYNQQQIKKYFKIFMLCTYFHQHHIDTKQSGKHNV